MLRRYHAVPGATARDAVGGRPPGADAAKQLGRPPLSASAANIAGAAIAGVDLGASQRPDFLALTVNFGALAREQGRSSPCEIGRRDELRAAGVIAAEFADD